MGVQFGTPLNISIMALRGLFSGKKVLVTERGLKKNTRYTVKVENLITGTSSVTTKRTKGGKITAGLKIDAKGVVKSTITSPSGETKIIDREVGKSAFTIGGLGKSVPSAVMALA